MSYALTQLVGFGATRSGGGNDAFTVALLHGDGSNGSTTITNSAAGGSTSFTADNGAAISTAQSVFGGASILFDGTDDDVSFDASGADWTWAGDFAIDFWIRPTSSALQGGGQRRVFGLGAGATNLELFIDNSPAGLLVLETGAGSVLITGTTNVADSTWRHVAITRSGTSLRLFVGGAQEGGTATDSTTWVGDATSYFGRYQGSAIGHYAGALDEIRVTKGVARWTGTFTPPSAPYS